MQLFGLTGGIGMGKSTCADLLKRSSVQVIDTDDLARTLTEAGQPAIGEICSAFGEQVIDDNGHLRRDVLAEIVFNDSSSRSTLESILHPRIVAVWTAQVEQWKHAGCSIGVVVIPLLFETSAESSFDATVCVACSAITQMERLADRGWTPQQSQSRIAAQLPLDQKMARSDYVLWSEGEVSVLARQMQRVFGLKG
jgi:dephospho-CoA kinase